MSLPYIPIPDSEHQLECAIEQIVVPRMKLILSDLHQSITTEATSVQAKDNLTKAIAGLDQMRVEMAGLLSKIHGLDEMLSKFAEWSCVEVGRKDVSGREQSLLSGYLSFENLISQLTDSVDQGRIDRGEAPTRFELINQLVSRYRTKSYLEIGCCGNSCFSRINCSQKVGVDPESGGTLRMTSDAFFEVNVQTFDLIFIDGLHESQQVDRDITNALRWTSPDGIIVMHDCDPKFEIRALVPRISEVWNGDVWKSFVRARSQPDLDCATGLFDHGTAVILKRPNSSPLNAVPESELTWQNLQRHRAEWLRPMPFNLLLEWIQT